MWEEIKDGEYNEWRYSKGKHTVTIYSDRAESNWHYSSDDGDCGNLAARDLESAKREAETDFRLNFGKDGMR